jgi:hypothetical protein
MRLYSLQIAFDSAQADTVRTFETASLLNACPIYSIIISAILAFKSRRDEKIIAIDVFIR